MTATHPKRTEPGLAWDQAVRHAEAVAATYAAEVDRDARFPREAITALREGGLLGAAAPAGIGGLGMTAQELVRVSGSLARRCGSTAMVWAMHQIQLACLVRHHPQSQLLMRALEEKWLIASVTSEAGIGGDLRRSSASVGNQDGVDNLVLRKQGTTISYGANAQGYLVTARRGSDTDQGNQVAVLVSRDQVRLTRTGEWNTLGMRGTCSPSFDLEMTFGAGQILPLPFGDIAALTMVPLSHILWAGVWIGLATEAVHRASNAVRLRHRPGAAFDDPSLALAHAKLAGARGQLAAALLAAEPVLEHGQASTITLGVELNALKIGVSEAATDVVRLALNASGMAGYSEDGPHSIARILRDVHSAPLMISNRRLLAANSQMLLAQRGER